ncbi:hypothetical protein HMPREF1872_00463 [Amygdalobacter nucleatus]|uniref:Uncharacterized protein n=1 Tax=Amygdalobacter nucleatus TaxID=3029274 RepID=A0A133YFM0_9FIRM|nr:hypothetical protein HMPREF1872_00463 [Amygdalobacter nucleatus]
MNETERSASFFISGNIFLYSFLAEKVIQLLAFFISQVKLFLSQNIASFHGKRAIGGRLCKN